MQKYECKVCRAELEWNPDTNSLKCKYCDSEFQASDFEDNTSTQEVAGEEITSGYTSASTEDGMVIYKCEECGAELVASTTTMATECAYCGRAISITSRASGQFRPEKTIPFAINKDKAMEEFKAYTKRSWLTPKSFSTDSVVEKMQGVFVPFYLHSMILNSEAEFEAEKIKKFQRRDDRVEEHKVYEVNTTGHGSFKDIPTDASTKMEDYLMDAIEPFSYDKIVDYNPAYMAGFFAEQPDETADDTRQRAVSRAKQGMIEKMQGVAGNFDAIKVTRAHHNISDASSKYAMIPVWLLNVDYNGNKYTYAVNGETGKISGKLPFSWAKVAIAGLVPFVGGQLLLAILQLLC